MRGSRLAAVAVAACLLAGCSGGSDESAPQPTPTAASPTSAPPTSTPPTPAAPSPSPTTAAVPAFDARAAMRDVRHLAGDGPRQATSAAFRRAARWVEARFTSLGYDVSRQAFQAPAGVSWGIPVPAGRTWNVVARPADLRPGQPYAIVGAHLDTVPQAPGAEDNASGVSVVLELARLAAAAPTRLPVVLVAYGAEEPRNASGSAHHFGSLTQVARLDAAGRRSLRAMVALDRVGVGRTVPVCTAGLGPGDVRRALLAAARRAGVPTTSCGVNLASDHESFERAGLPAARVGSTPYAGYHSAGDVASVVSVRQLRRTGRVLWAWLRA